MSSKWRPRNSAGRLRVTVTPYQIELAVIAAEPTKQVIAKCYKPAQILYRRKLAVEDYADHRTLRCAQVLIAYSLGRLPLFPVRTGTSLMVVIRNELIPGNTMHTLLQSVWEINQFPGPSRRQPNVEKVSCGIDVLALAARSAR